MKQYRNPIVAAFEAKRKADYDAAVTTVREIIATCDHDRVIQSGQRRICLRCGYEEATGYLSGWPGFTIDGGFYEFIAPAGQPTKLNTKFAARGDVVKHRVRL